MNKGSGTVFNKNVVVDHIKVYKLRASDFTRG